VGDDVYAEMPTFSRHQVVNRPSKFRYPRSPRTTHALVTEGSRNSPDGSVSPHAPRLLDTETPSHLDAGDPTAASSVNFVRERLQGDGRDSFDAVIRSLQRPESFAAHVRSLGPDGTDGRYTWDEIGRAILEAAATNGELTPRKLGGFLRMIREGAPRGRSQRPEGLAPAKFREAV